ncbi:MAG: tRNA (adenosine(37)-N6)-threonylcarbamoyltransferase complex ATPase subunit type 1 TsaE [Alphaproteobacteria bacterium]|jgi:tRNA threonylcarbamoyladenosine biosynthesis protein TsaE|nr:tRNA (adenosine(37)-N6)-threonylcarbamoyltransferase complex ATPase subunit type 1 TsaE [Alphaproteobacteria bacterium]
MQSFFLSSEAETEKLAARLAAHITPPLTLLLSGDLGAGKTFFVRSLLRALGWTGSVPSPTFTLRQDYETPRGLLVHVDAYRLKTADEAYALDLPPAFEEALVCIEWPEKLEGHAPAAHLHLTFSHNGEGRQVVLNPSGRAAETLLAALL